MRIEQGFAVVMDEEDQELLKKTGLNTALRGFAIEHNQGQLIAYTRDKRASARLWDAWTKAVRIEEARKAGTL